MVTGKKMTRRKQIPPRTLPYLQRVLENPPAGRWRTLKAPSDLPFARAALESYVAGLDKSKEAVQK
jgi:hypothetical protein